ncbi:FG-GAP repeat domain-containing protein [Rubritalea marina]|uniref:FG-GAP repeat domain-containing protein n=1 Tax=Rubritalea marina TaxID=361055 RepID=UPI001969DE7E|nr:VCBS repeat-containing protein [Rubritalea marina]
MNSGWICMVTAVGAMASEVSWKKHTVMDGGMCLTAVALDANEDGLQDVIAGVAGKVVLLLAPDWKPLVIHQLKATNMRCIHSAVLDVDGDGDLDWAGSDAHDHPFWLENPGAGALSAKPWEMRMIDHEITGIHCLLASDIDNDGKQDLVINNFEPEQGLKGSMAWFKVPEKPHLAPQWHRFVFADQDAFGGSHYMGAADVDGDGWKEIAVGAKGDPFKGGNWFAFWTNPGADGVQGAWRKTLLAEEQLAATNIVPADLNGDGKVDWVASRGHSAGVLWFENPAWTLHVIDPGIEDPHSLDVGDFDNDGDLDVASCGYGNKSLRWYENDGTAQFAIHEIDSDQESYDLRSIDMDGDGDLDLLNAGRASKNVVWYENLGGAK